MSSAPVSPCSSSTLICASFSRSTNRLVLDIDDGEAGIDPRHASHAGQRQVAALHQLRPAVLGDMIGDHRHALRAMHEVHRPAHGRHAFRAGRPVGEIARLGHLVGAKDRHVEMAAPHHGEAVGMVEEGGPRLQGDRFLSGIDQVPVLLALGRRLAEVEHAVLGMENRLPTRRLELRHHLGKADTEVDIGAVLDVLRGPPGDLRVGKPAAHA